MDESKPVDRRWAGWVNIDRSDDQRPTDWHRRPEAHRRHRKLTFTPDEAAFRDGLRVFCATQISAEIHDRVRSGDTLPAIKAVPDKIPNDHDLAVPN